MTGLALAAIAALTLVPAPNAPPVIASRFCIICGELGGSDFLLNIILFVPLGVGLRMTGASFWRAVLIALLTSTAVESLQLHVVSGRDASAGDLLSNSVGGALGAVLAMHWRAVLFPSADRSRRLAHGAALLWLTLATVTAASATLWSPGPEILYRRSAWGKQWGWYPGRVIRVASGGGEIAARSGSSDGRFAVPADVPPGGPVHLDLTATGGGVVARRAAIATVIDDDARDVAAVGQRRRDLIFRVRTVAALARVHVPGLTIVDLFAPRDERPARGGLPVAGDTLRVAADYTRRRLRLDVWWPGGHATRAAVLHPFIGWSYLLPWDYSYGRWANALSALWAGGLVVPAAYWAARAHRLGLARPRAPVATVLAAVTGLTVVPLLSGVGLAPALVWLGVAVGLVGGAWGGEQSAARVRSAAHRRG